MTLLTPVFLLSQTRTRGRTRGGSAGVEMGVGLQEAPQVPVVGDGVLQDAGGEHVVLLRRETLQHHLLQEVLHAGGQVHGRVSAGRGGFVLGGGRGLTSNSVIYSFLDFPRNVDANSSLINLIITIIQPCKKHGTPNMSSSTHSWMNFPIRTSHIHLMKRPTERLRPARALFDCRSWSPHTVYMAAARKHAWDTKRVWLDQTSKDYWLPKQQRNVVWKV